MQKDSPMDLASFLGPRQLPKPAIVAIAAVLVVAAALALLALYRIDPSHSSVFPACLLHSLTGLYCPGCGATRALHYLLHGELAAALAMNPLFIISLPAIAALILRPQLTRIPAVTYTAMVLVIGYAILRNIPVWPLDLLAPHVLP